MSSRVYILLDTVEGKASNVAHILRGRAGVRLVDVLEGSPDIIMMIQAQSRQQLADLTSQALATVESMTEQVGLLPTQNGQGVAGRKIKG